MRLLTLVFLLFTSIACAERSLEVLSESPRIILIHDFLTPHECDYLIKLARPELERSTVVDEANKGQGKLDSRRTSQGMFLTNHQKDKTIRQIETKLAEIAHCPQENGEAIHVLFYGKGGEYQPHYDFFNAATSGGREHLSRGGQRVVTVIMYLNTPTAGGATIFPTARVSVTPQKGNALLFYNCLPSGATDPKTLHGGAPVHAGEKWIATKWYRAERFK